MKRIPSQSKNELFLTEMILSLLILSLTACICVQIFVKAASAREEAREWNHIQEMTITVGEFLEGSRGTSEEFLSFFPNGTRNADTLLYYYDSHWTSCEKADSKYSLELTFSLEKHTKTAFLSFYKGEACFYEQKICFPVFSTRKEADFS